jgi:ABC-type sugar transport system substrate-binding protein
METQKMIKQGMLTVALAAVLAAGAASIAVAAPDTDPKGGFRELPNGAFVTDGVNPVFHPSMRGGNAYGYAPNAAKPTKTRTSSN